MKWYKFDELKGYRQKRPPIKKLVIVAIIPDEQGMPVCCCVGYRKNGAGDKSCPYFVRHGGPFGKVVAWCDCLPEGFEKAWLEIHRQYPR